jgi:hypothetical protein
MKALQAPYWWHGGTTCHPRCTVAWAGHDGRYLLLKHDGHNEWCGWSSGNKYCRTSYSLFDMEVVGNAHSVWNKPELCMATWDGRWTKAKQAHLEALTGKEL